MQGKGTILKAGARDWGNLRASKMNGIFSFLISIFSNMSPQILSERIRILANHQPASAHVAPMGSWKSKMSPQDNQCYFW